MRTTYWYDTGSWLLSRPKQASVCAETAATCEHTDSHRLASTSYAYVSATTLLEKKTLWLLNEQDGSVDTANSPVYRYFYDTYGNLKQEQDPEGNWTDTEYDTVSYTYPTRAVQWDRDRVKNLLLGTATYDQRCGALSTKTDANDEDITRYKYDGFCRLEKMTRPGDETTPNRTTTIVYEAANYGNVGTQKNTTYQTVDAANGKTTWKETYFDGLGRDIETDTQAAEQKVIVTETDYDARGLVTKESIPHFDGEERRDILYTYDNMGRKKTVTRPDDNPSGTVTSKIIYNKDGTRSMDPLDRRRIERLDGFGRLNRVTRYNGEEQIVTQYKYDPLGNLTSVTDPEGHATTIHYNSLSRKTWMRDPDTRLWTYEYDRNGNLHVRTDARGKQITFSRDLAGRVTAKDYGDSTETDVSYRYDSYDNNNTNNVKGRLARVTDGSGTTRYYYDNRGRISQVIRDIDGVSHTTKTAYDSMDRPTLITYPDNEQVVHDYDAGALKEVRNPAISGDFHAKYSDFTALGQVGTVVYGNNQDAVTTLYEYYEKSDRLKTLRTFNSNELQYLEYDYNEVGNITWIRDLNGCGQSQYMEYDGLDRLKLWQRKCGEGQPLREPEIQLFYFRDGNIKRNYRVDPANDYVYHSGHPHAATGTTAAPTRYDYDANGNMTKRNDGTPTTLTYDTDNRVTSISGTGSQLTFTYDHEGKRVKKKVGSTSTTVYVGDLYECTNGSCTKHIMAGGQRIAWKNSTGLYYYHGDHLKGLNTATRDTDGSVCQTDRYYPFGEVRTHSGATNYAYKFTGQPLDPESGLYYYGARYYHPFIGRFISADPIVQAFHDPPIFPRLPNDGNLPGNVPVPTDEAGSQSGHMQAAMGGLGNNTGTSASTADNMMDFGYRRSGPMKALAFAPKTGVGSSGNPAERTGSAIARLYDKAGTNSYAYVQNNPVKLLDPLGLFGLAVDFGGAYATGWGGPVDPNAVILQGGSAGSGFYLGTKGIPGQVEIGAYTYQSLMTNSGRTPGAALGVSANLTFYFTNAEDFFPGQMKYTEYVVGPFGFTFYEDPSNGELTGFGFSWWGEGGGWLMDSSGFSYGTIDALQ